MRDWKQVADALTRLAEDQRGKPEGIAAREKLLEILAKYPEARSYEPIISLVKRDIKMADIGWMKAHGVSTDGEWKGRSMDEAIAKMNADYAERIAKAKARRLMGDRWLALLEGATS